MDFKKLIKGYQSGLKSLALLFLCVGLCFCLAFIIVFPLWFLATRSKSIYTILCLTLFFGGFAFLIIKSIIKKIKEDANGFAFSLGKFLVTFLGIIGAIFSVLTYHRILAMFILILSFLLYGFVAYGLPSMSKSKNV